MIAPQVMKRMITHVTLIELDADGVHPWQGYFYSVLMFAVLSARTILEAQYYGTTFHYYNLWQQQYTVVSSNLSS